jgi:hypothetical protein
MDEKCLAERVHSLEEWIEVFKKDPPTTLDIAGGEPFSIPWMVPFIKRLGEEAETKDVRVGLSTNGLFSKNILSLCDERLRNVISINMSFHPNIVQWMSSYIDRYKENIGKVKECGYHIFSSIVDYKNNVAISSGYGIRDWLEEKGIQLVISPYEDMDVVMENTMSKKLACDGGITHKVFSPGGYVFPCLTTLRSPARWERVLGNVFDPEYDPSSVKRVESCQLFCYDYYILQRLHPSGDMWSVNAREVE